MRFVIGVVIASIVLFIWGFIYWGAIPFYRFVWEETENTDAVGAALAEHFPRNGTYFVPRQDQTDAESLYMEGPVAMVHMLRVEGRPMFDTSIMVKGFALNVVVVFLIGYILSIASPALKSYMCRVSFAGLLGLAAAVMIDFGEVVWWQIDWKWQLYAAVYHVTAALVVGLVLAAFISAPKTGDP